MIFMRIFIFLICLFSSFSSLAQIEQILEEPKLITNIMYDFANDDLTNKKHLVISNSIDYFKSFFVLGSCEVDSLYIWNKHENKRISIYMITSYIIFENLSKSSYDKKISLHEIRLEVFYFLGNQCLGIKDSKKEYYFRLKNSMLKGADFIFIFERI